LPYIAVKDDNRSMFHSANTDAQPTDNSGQAAGLYIHIPFCRRKCPYCDFTSTTDLDRITAFCDSLQREMELTAGAWPLFDSVYIGGGTPSVLAPEAVGAILESARRMFAIDAGAEVTIEVNPGTLAAGALKYYRECGVNRVNIGVQSFQEAHLEFLGRIHSAADSREALAAAGRAGFAGIGLDLIYGLPGQGRGDWLADLQTAVGFRPDHISCYMLTCEPGTPLAADFARGRFQSAGEETVRDLFAAADTFLAGQGYRHYEISNWACSDSSRSRHNRKYWTFAPYLGLGPAAHSFFNPHRRWNTADVDDYIRQLASGRLPVAGSETLSRAQKMIEAVFLGLRTAEGIPIGDFERRFGVGFDGLFAEEIERFRARGLVVVGNGHCRLTVDGMLLLDAIAAALVAKIPDEETVPPTRAESCGSG
jgi:putative oxygen-independent coproporphyrinogen III oxidase